ncbi:AbrB/MazE/SpoVT family DNA-binding domain-containing protein [bacterium]|nr:AbrB/MazE/SpoVT family DNA-binding domain-containing protein [bacterium]
MRITSKGQITIPAEIREQLGFLPSTEVRVRISAHKGPSRGSKALDLLRGRATVPLTTEEILALTRGE